MHRFHVANLTTKECSDLLGSQVCSNRTITQHAMYYLGVNKDSHGISVPYIEL